MIRFCDMEICCVTENMMDWQQMADYFLDWHMDEEIYILDEKNKYIGSVCYNSLFNICPENAVQKECITLEGNRKIWVVKDSVILDESIWQNVKKYFQVYDTLLPVLNKEYQLICFAWDDAEANREIRMLDEIMEFEKTVGFKNVFPEVGSVTVHGYNELAYYFVYYLRQSGILVNVTGQLWGEKRCF